MDGIAIEMGSGNVFADLGVLEPEGMLLRSSPVIELRRPIQSRGLTRAAAAEIIGIEPIDLSKIHDGRLRGCTAERLMLMLTALDQDIDILVRPRGTAGEAGRITVLPADP